MKVKAKRLIIIPTMLVLGVLAVSVCSACSAGSAGSSSSLCTTNMSHTDSSASSSSSGRHEQSAEKKASGSSENGAAGDASPQMQGSSDGCVIVTPYYTVEIPAGWPDGSGAEITYDVDEGLKRYQDGSGFGIGCMTSIRVGSGAFEVSCFTNNWGPQGDLKSVVVGEPPNLPGWLVAVSTPSDSAAEKSGITPFASRIQEFASFVRLGGEGVPESAADFLPAPEPTSVSESSPTGGSPSKPAEPAQTDSVSAESGQPDSSQSENAAEANEAEKETPEPGTTVSEADKEMPDPGASGTATSNSGQETAASVEKRADFESRLSSINSAKSADTRMGGTTADMIQAGNDYYAQYDALMGDVLSYLESQPSVDRSQLTASQDAWRAELTAREQEAKAANGGGSLMGVEVLGIDMEMQQQRIRELIAMIP